MTDLFNHVVTEKDVPATDVLTPDVRVLFADESKDTIATFKHITNRLDWKGTYVSSATELIEAVNGLLASHTTLDAIVADINYFTGPRLTGITAAREVRKAMPNVPIVFISAYVTSIIKEEVRRVKAEIYQKPYDPQQLLMRLAQMIYSNRLATANSYTGENRRRNSVNRTINARRVTDTIISVPERIIQTLSEVHYERR